MNKTDAKQSLINAVRELLLSGQRFTVKDITARAYTNVAAINYYFGDKNSLINLVLDELVEGYRKAIVDTLRMDYESPDACVRAFLSLVGRMYVQNKGVIRFLVSEDTGNKSNYINSILLDPELTKAVFEKMRQMNGEMSREAMLCNYLICVSAFVMPLLVQVQNDEGGLQMPLEDIMGEEMREVFVRQLMRLF